jgi:glycosyltransferase involved in cell wall biosynthesis
MAPERRIICVGAMKNRNKNGLAAVRAFIAFAQGRPDWTLDLYGVNNFKAELNSLKASAAVRINDHGVVQGAATIYQNAHALVIPSYEEGLPNVVVEAFSFGVPCIGYRDCIAVAALIEHEVTGLLVERSDPDDLARALVRLADPQEHARMAANAIAFARQNFQPSNWRQNWLEMVANACAGVDRFGQGRLPPARRNDVHGKYWRDILAAHRPIG